MPAERAAFETSEDAVLGGRLRLRQPRRGHRVGHDAILLAAVTEAKAGEHAVDLGAGVGAAGLALAVRVEGLTVTLVEIDEGLCALANGNARLNKLDGRVRALAADAGDPQALAAASLKGASVDRALMNPPFHDARRTNVSPDPVRRLAHVGEPGLLPRWVASAAILLKPRGVLTLIWRADSSAIPVSYTVFVQLLNSEGVVIAQSDAMPAQGERPTTNWREGEYIVDTHRLAYNGLAQPGAVQVIVGWYDASTNQRLRHEDGTDALSLGEFEIAAATISP